MNDKKLERQRAASKRYYHRHKEKEQKRHAIWVSKNRELYKELAKEWREKNPDYQKEWANKNRDKLRAAGRKWGASNPDKIRAKAAARRAKITKVGGKYTAEDIIKIKRWQRDRCAYCRKAIKGRTFDVDHIVPLCLGGTNDATNLQLLCATCNRSKGGRDPISFAQSLGFLL